MRKHSSSGTDPPTIREMDEFAGDLRLAAIEEARLRAPTGVVTSYLDAVLACADTWSTTRLVDEVLDLARDMAGADCSALFGESSEKMSCLGMRPQHLDAVLTGIQATDRFPWDLPRVRPRRFLLVGDAALLPLAPGITLGLLGVASAVHLPLAGPGGERGALHLYWGHTVDRWDDRVGALLRAVGVFVLHRVAAQPVVRPQISQPQRSPAGSDW